MNCENWNWLLVMGTVQLITSLVEMWLGKTERVKSSSILELVWNLIKIIVTKPIRRL